MTGCRMPQQYRLKEPAPGKYRRAHLSPLGVPEVLQEGPDLTLVTSGSCVRGAGRQLTAENNISVRTDRSYKPLPFDLEHTVVES